MKRKQETASQPIHKAMRTRSKHDSGAAVHLAARSRQESPEQGGHELSPSSGTAPASSAVRSLQKQATARCRADDISVVQLAGQPERQSGTKQIWKR